MSSRAWRTNAHSRIADFVESHNLVDPDIETLFQFAQRLIIDPFDVRAERDSMGEFYCRIGLSKTYSGQDLTAGYRIDESYRTVYVISFSVVDAR